MEQTVAQKPGTIRDMYVAIQREAIERMRASQENIDSIKGKQREALDKGDSENFEIHKLAYESNLRTLDSHRKLVLEITERLSPDKPQDERALPVISKLDPSNPLDMAIDLLATTEDGNSVVLKIKCDLHGLLKQRPFYGFEDTEPKVSDGPDHDLLQAACGFVLRGYVEKTSALDLVGENFKDFQAQTVKSAKVEEGEPVVFSGAEKIDEKVAVKFQNGGTEYTVEISDSATVVVTRDRKHIWYSNEKVENDKNSSFAHLMSISE